MSDQEFIKALTSINRWSKNKEVALHKPLLLLYMLGQYWHGASRIQKFSTLSPKFLKLMKKFYGPNTNELSALRPFYHLASSKKVWDLIYYPPGSFSKSNQPTPLKAKRANMQGGFTELSYHKMKKNKDWLIKIIFVILKKYFPASLHLPLLQEINVPSGTQPNYQQQILLNYHYSCSICKFPSTENDISTDLTVAYIKLPAFGGPLDVTNCISLCNIHNSLLDFGAISLANDGKILVSRRLKEIAPQLRLYEGNKALFPAEKKNWPNIDYLLWHRNTIFLCDRK